MQRERSTLVALAEAWGIEDPKGFEDFVYSDDDTDTTFPNSVYHEQRDLDRFRMEIGRFEERRNDNLELNPLFVQPSIESRAVRSVNLNAEYNEHLGNMNQFMGHPGLGSGLIPENSVRADTSVDGHRASCKRKALDGGIGQSSSNRGFREFQRGESSSRVPAPALYNPVNDLNISLDHGPMGLVSGAVPNLSTPSITESSSRNFSVRVSPTNQQETVNPAVFSAGSVIRRPAAPSFSTPGLLPADQHPIGLGYGNALGSFGSQNPNASATRMPPVSRTMVPPFPWSVSPAAAGGSSSSAASVDRSVIHQDETSSRSNNLESPFFVPAPRLGNLPHCNIIRNPIGATHVGAPSSRTTVQPSPSNPPGTPYHNHSPQNQRRLSEHFRRSLLSSLATNQRAARSSIPPASPDEHVLQSSGDNNFQGQNRSYSRAGPRQGQNAIGSHTLRGLASTSRGRSRVEASEIRTVVEQMHRGGNLRFEDVMLLNQSMVLGGADIPDRYRDMRLDVDNMTYEELLSLEEQIGDVCTGLNEETISNRLKQHKFKSTTRSPQEVEPCCVCQEEYKEGEEMGMLECGHDFHSQCIKEWLKRKNICPICKTTGLNTTEKRMD